MTLTQEDFGQISEIVQGAIKGLATKDELQTAVSGLATKAELQTAVSGLTTKVELEVGLDSVKSEIRQVRSMLEEDYSAEADRVTRISRRLDRTRAELKQHIADGADI